MNSKLGYFKLEEAGPGGDGGSGAPTSAAPPPSSEPAPSAPPAADPPAVNWDELIADGALPSGDEDEPPAGDPPAGDQPPADSPPGDQPPAQPPAQAPVPPQPPAQPPAQPAAPQKTQEEQVAEAKAYRAQLHDQWSKVYENEMTDETKNALITAPETVLPKLMAQAAMDAVDYARREFQAALPQIIAQHVGQTNAGQKAWSEFESLNKDLAKPEYRQTIADAAKFVKAKRPNLKPEEAMTTVARMARAALGLPEPKASNVPVHGQPPAAPHTPIARGRARPAPTAAKPEVGADGIDWGSMVS